MLDVEGYHTPTAIQAAAIPLILAGKDVVGVAQTGTGKTAAFAVPMIQRLMDPAHKVASSAVNSQEEAHNVAKAARKIRALVLSPTRELAGQIEASFKTYGRGTPLRVAVIFGGVSAHWQIKALYHGVDVLVATPGRLLDLMNQGYVDLRHVQTLVLDEADQMLDMGFIPDIRRIVAKVPEKRQTLLFSATMPDEIRRLADSILKHPETVQVTPVASTVDAIDQSLYFVDRGAKPSLLVKYINDNGITRALVFTRTKHGADKVAKYLDKAGIPAKALHGNKTQGQRNRAMEAFKSQRPPILVATDIAARGLDIDNVSHVVNYDIPNVPETYVHRIGRTGRAGATGCAVSFVGEDEHGSLSDIQRLIKRKIKVVGERIKAPAGTHAASGAHQPAASHAAAPPPRQITTGGAYGRSGQQHAPRPHSPKPHAHPKPHAKPQAHHAKPHTPHPKPHVSVKPAGWVPPKPKPHAHASAAPAHSHHKPAGRPQSHGGGGGGARRPWGPPKAGAHRRGGSHSHGGRGRFGR
jgi:ATP-dependent RNA helicase RhlE